MKTSTVPGGVPSLRPSSRRKHAAILDAAADAFVTDGFDAASMDGIAARSGVSKQTIYTYFGGKEQLFLQVVARQSAAAFDAVQDDGGDLGAGELGDSLRRLGERQLDAVLAPRLLALRRLVISEARRFPELARTFWDGGPGRMIEALAQRFATLHERGLLNAPDPGTAAATFNWLLMAGPLNEAMLCGDAALPDVRRRRAIAAEAVRVFLAAYGAGGIAAEARRP